MNANKDIFSDETSASEQFDEDKSKSQIKREREALKELAQELSNLPIKHLQLIPLDDNTRTAIIDVQKMKKGAMKRQLQHIGGLLRDEDETAIRLALDKISLPHRQQVKAHHQLEEWRDALVAGEDSIIAELTNHFNDVDRQYLMQLARNARKELKLAKPPKSARIIFQYLKDLQTQE
jgi:ribosome-associated protein